MNNIYDDCTLEEMNFKHPVKVHTESIGDVLVEKGDEEIVKKIGELATAAWKRDNENTAGWEYFAAIADACNVDFLGEGQDDYGERVWREYRVNDRCRDAFGSDDLIDEYKD